MPDNDIRPIESDDTYTYDVQTAGYQGRARTAAAQYRSTSNPSNFEPAPDAPQDDPEPSAEDEDILPNGSSKVDYYDGLAATHSGKTATEVTRFGNELSDYADYYNAHIKKAGESDYQMPVSQVEPLDIVDDGAERPSESNLVSDYDVAAGGYSSISVASSTTTGQRSVAYEDEMTTANSDIGKILSDDSNPSYTSIKKVSNSIQSKIDAMPENVRKGLKDISQFQ